MLFTQDQILTTRSLGIPKIDPGVSLSYDFYDQNISTEVEHVFQALATHERLFAFEPCFPRRKELNRSAGVPLNN